MNLQVSAGPAFDTPLRAQPFRPVWVVRLLARWRRADRLPLVLRRVAPLPHLSEAPISGRPTLEETAIAIARAAVDRPGALMNAYVASAVDIALEAEALSYGAAARRVRVPLHDLVAQVSEALQPCAAAVGASLVHDRHSRWSSIAATDPARLRKAVHHLVLRALSGPGDAGAVRIMVVSEAASTRISVVSLRGATDPGPFDLGPLTRMLQAIGAALVVESGQAGCAPVAIVLPSPPAPPLGLGDPDGEIVFGRRS